MVNAFDVPASDLIHAVAKELKNSGKLKQPEWAVFAKTGAHKERPPEQEDFWYLRGASVLVKIYKKGSLGTQRLRTEYGGKKNRGSKPNEYRKAGGSIIRKLMQQLEAAGYLQKAKLGRVVSPAGQKLLDNIAFAVYKKPKTREEAVEQVKEKAKEMAGKLPEQAETKLKIVPDKKEKQKKDWAKKEGAQAGQAGPAGQAGLVGQAGHKPEAKKPEAKPEEKKAE